MAWAERTQTGRYRVFPTKPVGDVATLFDRARAGVAVTDTVFMGFDFPIGLPLPYARQLGFHSFREALPQFGQAPYTNFYEISSTPAPTRPFYPPPARQKGLYTRQALAQALQVPQFNDLLRLCDRATQPPAGCMFFTLGGQQPGPGMMIGWRDVLAPALEHLHLWPFDGPLDTLLEQSGIVVCEAYPAEASRQLGLVPGRQWSKRRAEDRQAATARLLSRLSHDSEIEWSAAARTQLETGCATEDDFDALVTLVFMLEIVLGRITCPAPADPGIRAIEGWILGLPMPAPVS